MLLGTNGKRTSEFLVALVQLAIAAAALWAGKVDAGEYAIVAGIAGGGYTASRAVLKAKLAGGAEASAGAVTTQAADELDEELEDDDEDDD